MSQLPTGMRLVPMVLATLLLVQPWSLPVLAVDLFLSEPA